MRKIIVIEMMTLDGVIQGPGGPEEDTSGGFRQGGWVAKYADELSGRTIRKQMEPAEYLLGRKTFEIWEPYWPAHADVWPGISQGAKYIFSNTRDRSAWEHSVFLNSVAELEALKRTEGPDLQVWGSSQLVQLLLENGLVDELWLKVYPLVLGEGKKLFGDQAIPAAFELVESFSSPSGILFATYRRAGEMHPDATQSNS